MKDTGMSRKIDHLGRLVLPSEIRKNLGVKDGDALDIWVDDNKVILSPKQERCVFCRSATQLRTFRGRMVCSTCRTELVEQPGSEWDPFKES